jgi:hypothetical protein
MSTSSQRGSSRYSARAPEDCQSPVRLTMTLPDTGQSYRIGGRRAKNTHYTLEYTTRVCARCNSEWMNDMDDLAFPRVSEMICGNSVHFDSAMAAAVAGWVCKVVVTARSHPLHPMLVWLAGEGTVTVKGKNYPCHHPRCSHRSCAADHVQVVLRGCPRCPPTWCWTGRGGTGSNAADLRNGSPNEAGPGC